MMQAGKDYIAKQEPEYESPRAIHLRELLQTVKAQTPSDPDAPSEQTEQPKPKPTIKQPR